MGRPLWSPATVNDECRMVETGPTRTPRACSPSGSWRVDYVARNSRHCADDEEHHGIGRRGSPPAGTNSGRGTGYLGFRPRAGLPEALCHGSCRRHDSQRGKNGCGRTSSEAPAGGTRGHPRHNGGIQSGGKHSSRSTLRPSPNRLIRRSPRSQGYGDPRQLHRCNARTKLHSRSRQRDGALIDLHRTEPFRPVYVLQGALSLVTSIAMNSSISASVKSSSRRIGRVSLAKGAVGSLDRKPSPSRPTGGESTVKSPASG